MKQTVDSNFFWAKKSVYELYDSYNHFELIDEKRIKRGAAHETDERGLRGPAKPAQALAPRPVIRGLKNHCPTR